MADKKRVMKFITQIRDMAGITQYQLAKAFGIQQSQLRHYESAGKALKPAYICALKEISGLSWKQFGEMLEDEYSEEIDKLDLEF